MTMALPLSALPIVGMVQKEVVTLLRARWVNVLFLLFFGSVWLLLFFAIAEMPMYSFQLNQLASLVELLMGFVTVLLMGSITFFVSTSSATAVIQEIQRETAEMLSVTLIRPWQFLLAKLISTVGLAMLLSIAFMPIVALAYFGIGVNVEYVAELYLVAFTTAVAMGCAGLAAGSYIRRVTFANVVSMVAAGMILVGYPILLALVYLILNRFRFGDFFESAAYFTSPAFRLGMIFDGFVPASVRRVGYSTLLYVGFMALQSAVYFAVAWRRVVRIWRSPTSEIPRGIFTRTIGFGRWRAMERPVLGVIPDGMNPIWFLESRVNSRLVGLGGWRIFFWSCFLNVIVFLWSIWLPSNSAAILVWGVFLSVALPVIMPAFAAPLFSRELENDTFTSLRMTLLEHTQYFGARARVLFGWMAIVLAPVFVLQVISIAVGLTNFFDRANYSYYNSYEDLQGVGIFLFPSYLVLFTGAVFHSLYASVRVRSTMVALVLGELLIACTGLLFFLLVMSLFAVFMDLNVSERDYFFLFPTIAIVEVIDGSPVGSSNIENWFGSMFYVCTVSVIYAVRSLALCRNRYTRPER